MKRQIFAPGLFEAAPYAHAVRLDEILYVSSMTALERDGTLAAPGDLLAQARKIYENIGLVLQSAGARWEDVAKVNHFHSSPGPTPEEFDGLKAVVAEFLPPGRQAGTDVCLGPAAEGGRLQVEVIAHIGEDKRTLTGGASNHGALWAPGVRVGRHVYLSSRRAYGVRQDRAEGSTLAAETHAVYADFDALLREAGVEWRDMVRVRQFVTDPAADFNRVREGREAFVPPGAFTSTSVCSLPGDPSGRDGGPWTIAVDLYAATGTKLSSNTNALVQTPATAHALTVAGLVHMQAEIPDVDDEIIFVDDIEAQSRFVLEKMQLLLEAGGCTWDDVVTSRVFCRDREHLEAVRKAERTWAGSAVFARSDAVCRFFDPNVLVEIELTAARR
ncbi:MAG: Rid family hydrolase [Caulobacteraceae bacterium]